jgi:hypothetical protein
LACLPDKAGGLPKQIYLDAMHLNLRREENRRVFAVRIDLDGYRNILGHWLGDGGWRDFKRDPLRCPWWASPDGLIHFDDPLRPPRRSRHFLTSNLSGPFFQLVNATANRLIKTNSG